MSVSTRTRFEVLKRDAFKCAYCGATAVRALIEVDHVVPVSKGGTDDAANLVAACWDCNHGKSDVPLEERKLGEAVPAEVLSAHTKQIKAYLREQRKLIAAQDQANQEVLNLWCKHSGRDCGPTDILRKARRLLETFSLVDLDKAFELAFIHGPYNETKKWHYAQAILRRWREEAQVATRGRA